MIKLVTPKIKKSGGPGIFMFRLLEYMQEHELVKVVDRYGDIHFSTVWGDKFLKGHKHVYRAAAAYYNLNQKKRHGLNKRIAQSIKNSDHVIFQTKFAKNMCQKILKTRAKKSSIICNGFNTSIYDHITPEDVSDIEHLFVACSDWTSTAKRGVWIIEAYKRAKISNSKLVIIGPGIKKTNDKNIIFLGKSSIEQISAYLKNQPYFIHICYAEACPNAAIEALSFGCPVVCNNIGGTPEVVNEDGVIAECDNPFIFKRCNVKVNNFDINKVSSALNDITLKMWNIYRPDLSMSVCANKYYQVFKDVIS